MTCKECIFYEVCLSTIPIIKAFCHPDYETAFFQYAFLECDKGKRHCINFKNKADFEEVVRCMNCKHSRPLNKTKSPEKYYKDSCIACECEDVVGDEPMIYPGIHYCSYGERRDT